MRRLLLGILLLGAAQAAELRVYPSFAEVRDAVRAQQETYTVTFPESVWAQMVPGTLDLAGLNVRSRLQLPGESWLAGLEGRSVTLLRDGRSESVTLIRARDFLVRDAQGRYRFVEPQQLAYPQLPPHNHFARGQQVTFDLAAPGSGTLSYLTQAVSWLPRYTLSVNANGALLAALADIRNTSEQAYRVSSGELIAGQVNLVSAPFGGAYNGKLEAEMRMDAARSAPAIDPLGESRGVHRYALTRPFELPANSTLTLPFLQPRVSLERFAGLTTGFVPAGTDGNLHRRYRLRSDVLLPAGPVTVRDEGRVVGQAIVDDTAAGQPVELDLGADPQLRFVRDVALQQQERGVVSYRVALTLMNDKDRVVRAEVREFLGANATVQGQAERVPQGLLVRAELPAGGRVTRVYSVTVRDPSARQEPADGASQTPPAAPNDR